MADPTPCTNCGQPLDFSHKMIETGGETLVTCPGCLHKNKMTSRKVRDLLVKRKNL